MSINENTRLIDLKVSDLLAILKESTPPIPAQVSADDDEIGGYEVAERITGYARQTLYQLKSAGEIPYIALPNGGVRFSKKALLSWLLSHKKMTSGEIADKAESFVRKRHLRRR
ncbi:helix-turn-helix transcriptional regulator [Solitalea lacus]|uniref:helix-turn-helix transcriptional regulator n=1 Tax=Solitalea lacus TaxID=2911172 RepID=UPI001EDC555B|nr:helix-turn-helix domain-containing protein [Solitalea lacus]UKJ07371.1 helix-turn-helix domain-containing protein [Solitalea lacus]